MVSGCKLCYLPNRSVIEISGPDRFSFLQGLVTQDIMLLEGQKAIYTLLLTPQGKFLFDFFVIAKDESFWLDCRHDKSEALIKRLSVFKLRSNVEICPIEAHVVADLENELEDGFQDPRHHGMGFRAVRLGISPEICNASKYESLRIKLCIPEGDIDLPQDKAIPLECRMDELNAISWDKGCYLGQELTARTKYRGLVHKKLFAVEVVGGQVAPMDEVFADENKVGTIRSVVDNLAIAMIRIEAKDKALVSGQASLSILDI